MPSTTYRRFGFTATIVASVIAVLIAARYGRAADPGDGHASLRVASVSFVPLKWDKDANARRIEELVREAARQGARLVITPEGALEGYVVNEVIDADDQAEKDALTARFQALAEPIDGPYVRRIAQLADELDVYIILGVLLRGDEATTYNTAVLLDPEGKVAGRYNKTHFHQGYDVNPPGYTPGNEYPVFDVGAARLGMMICFDRQLPEPARALALGGANLIVCPSYGGTGDWNTRMMQVRAYENDVYLVFTHPRQSLIIAPDGELLAESEGNAVTVYDLDLSRQTRRRQSIRNRRPETYQDLERREPEHRSE
ncbi:MAG: carbon-nitrogen hydrolase family protein [Pirellulales bacterium]